MAIATRKPIAQLPSTLNLPKIEPDSYQGVARDDKYTPLRSLVAYVEGAPWQVCYYSQIVTKHNDLREVDPGEAAVYQQYQKVIDLEIRVSDPLSSSYDSSTGITTVTGSATMYPTMRPNVSDYFVADTADSKKAIYRITNVDRKTFNVESVYAVDYELVAYVSVQPQLYADLEAKSIRVYYFSKDRLVEGVQPMVKDSEHQQIASLKANYIYLVKYYFKAFFTRKYMTVVLPGQQYGIYDSFMANYLMKIVDTFDTQEVRLVKQLPSDYDPYMAQPQFWDLLLNKDYQGRTACNKKMGIVQTTVFNSSPYLQGASFHNSDYVVYPALPDETCMSGVYENAKVLSMNEIVEVANANGNVADLLSQLYVTPQVSYQLTKKVLEDDFYVLSEAFYTGTGTMSVLEILVKDYLNNSTINLDMLYALINVAKGWGRLEQYYYIPILITLIKEADRSAYT